MKHKTTFGEYDLWQGYDGVWYWQVYKPTKDRLVSGNASSKDQAETQAIDAIKRLISPQDTFNPLKYRF